MTEENNFSKEPGEAVPLGTTQKKTGINFAIFSDVAKQISLCLFDEKAENLVAEFSLDPKKNKTGDVWHIFLKDLPDTYTYGYRVDGVMVSDPYARSLTTGNEWGKDKKQILGHLVFNVPFDWEGVQAPNIPSKDLIIYEMHVRGFTAYLEGKSKGTFLGIIEKIPYLKKLGINAVELLPVFEFDECENKHVNPKTKERLYNFWGYSTINFFTPMQRFASSPDKTTAILEFKTMVRELHKVGIEVILDVVYNHTAEAGEDGPVYNFKALSKESYYLLDTKKAYKNYSGCGNTMNTNHPVCASLIVDSLRYWVDEMHVDGFRFDLASILTREEDGRPISDPYVVRAITEDPVLAEVKLIAEAWDAGGLYQVGSFPHYGKWAEWNGKYRDSVRRFIKGTYGSVGDFCRAICGSEELYGYKRHPHHSINFITAHDGYSLFDLVTYQNKHNEVNGEQNRDGSNDNINWNCGVEGPSDKKEIIEFRQRQIRNYFLTLMISIGTPMMLMGDEYEHTRLGNNNPYCQDNDLNWFLWQNAQKQEEFFNFVTKVIAFRKETGFFSKDTFLTKDDITWHGITPLDPQWSNDSRFIAYALHIPEKNQDIYVAFNSDFHNEKVTLPETPAGKKWYLKIDTSKHPAIFDDSALSALIDPVYLLHSYSILVLISL